MASLKGAAAAALLLVWAGAGGAEEAASGGTAEPAEEGAQALAVVPVPEPAPVAAPPDATELDTLTVTVGKRLERAQESSNAVTVLTGKSIVENNVQDYATLAKFTPGMVTRAEDSITIRGIGKARGGTSPVAFHVNGFILEGRGERFYDLSSIDVLRGPSGTVYGRNATAGAINAKWNAPELFYNAGGDVRLGSFDDQEIRAFLNVPLLGSGNKLAALRVAGVKVEQRGYYDNLLAQADHEPGGADDGFARMYLVSEPSDALRVGLQWIETRSSANPGVASPSAQTRRSGLLEKYGAQRPTDNLLEVRSVQYTQFPAPWGKGSRAVGELTWRLTELPWLGDVDLDFMGGQAKDSSTGLFDLDGTEEPIVETITDDRATGRNAELRFTSQNGGWLKWLAGVFWYHRQAAGNLHVDARIQEDVMAFAIPETADFLATLPQSPSDRIFDADVDYVNQQREDRSAAVFLNGSVNLAALLDGFPEIEVFGGGRLNRDKLHLKTDRETIYVTDYETGGSPPVPIDDKSTDIRGRFKATTGELGAKWLHERLGPIEEGMLYGKYASGYKPGTVQLLAGSELNQVDPEHLRMLEVGWKAAFLRRALVVNLTAFDYDYEDLQVGKIVITGQKLENAGQATIRGIELEAQFTPSAQLFTQLGFSLLRARFGEFCGKDEQRETQAAMPGCTDDEPHNFAGAAPADAPDHSLSALVRYSFDLGGWGTLAPALTAIWLDEYQRRSYGNPIDTVDSHTKTDLRLSFETPQQALRIEAFVENLEDHDDIFADHFSMPDPNGYSLLSVAPPRTIGVRIEGKF
jgi:iron complex outermembrane recepter protein